MTESAIGSPMLKLRAPLVLDLPDEAWFDVELMHKDVGLALAAAREAGVPLASAGVADELLSRAAGLGYEHRDIAAMFEVLGRIGQSSSPAPACPASVNAACAHVLFVLAELHAVLACGGAEPLDLRLLHGKRSLVLAARRVPEVPEEPFEARRHEAGEHPGCVGGGVAKRVDGSARHVVELSWSQWTPVALDENLDAALYHEEELVRVSVCMG